MMKIYCTSKLRTGPCFIDIPPSHIYSIVFCPVWAVHFNKPVDKLDRVQKRATRISNDLENRIKDRHKNWDCLVYRRKD